MNGKTLRLFRVNGKTYEKGARISLPDAEFETFEELGVLERAKPTKIAKGNDPA